MGRNGRIALVFHALFITFIFAPLVTVVAVSFTPLGYISLPTDAISFRWFEAVVADRAFVSSVVASVNVAVVATLGSLAICVPAALAIGRQRFPGRTALTALMLAPVPVPTIVIGVALLGFLSTLALSGSIAGLVLGHIVVISPFVVRILLASVAGLDPALTNAALSLGASRWTAFRLVTLPLLAPGIFGAGMMAFILSFDELTVSLFVSGGTLQTIPVWLFDRMTWGLDPTVAAASTLIIVATILMMLLADRTIGLDRLFLGREVRDR